MLKFSVMISVAVMAAAAVFSAASAGDDDDKEPKLSEEAAEVLSRYERTGEFTNCVGVRRIRRIDVLDDHYLLVDAGGQTYLNITNGSCDEARRSGTRLQYEVPGGLLCRLELVRVVDNIGNIDVGFCTLQDFELLKEKPPADDGAGND